MDNVNGKHLHGDDQMETTGESTSVQVPHWDPNSWIGKPNPQETVYNEEQTSLKKKIKQNLTSMPPLVTPTEIEKLKSSLRDCARGEAFLLQGGDCAELFEYCNPNAIEGKMKLLLQMSLVLIWGLNKPVVRIARMAGQYAKPRSSPTEVVNGQTVSSFKGDILNGFPIDERTPSADRLLSAYFHSAATLNYIRASLASGIADLHRPLDWGLGHVRDPDLQSRYTKIVTSITDSLRFMKTVGVDTAGSLETVDLYTSHEGLVLDYESPLTRELHDPINPGQTKYYDTSAHFLWIGDRTRQLEGAHVEFFRGVANPIGIKIGPTSTPQGVIDLIHTLNPHDEVGKITLITRFGASKVNKLLPGFIQALHPEFAGKVVWQCDPMHGNTRSTESGIKTRQFQDILSELQETLAIHRNFGSYLGGVHLEMTGDAVTECTGGSENLMDDDLSLNYTSFCDPRLNEKQSLEMAFLIAGFFRTDHA